MLNLYVCRLAYKHAYLCSFVQVDFMPFDPMVKRTEGTVRTSDGPAFKVSVHSAHAQAQCLSMHSTLCLSDP